MPTVSTIIVTHGLGDAQIVNRGDVGQYGAVYKIVYETTKEYMNKRTCFAINGSSDAKVMPQGIFPDMGQYTVRWTTLNGERFAGLNFCGFHPIKFSWENFCDALCLKHLNNAVVRK